MIGVLVGRCPTPLLRREDNGRAGVISGRLAHLLRAPWRLRGKTFQGKGHKKARGNAYGPKTKKGNTMKKGLPHETQTVFYGWWSEGDSNP